MNVRIVCWGTVWVVLMIGGVGCAQMIGGGCAQMTNPFLKIPCDPPLPRPAVDILGGLAFEWTMMTSQLAQNSQQQERLERVANRLIEAAKQNKKYAETAKNAQWEIKLIKDDGKANAFVFPNGKIGVYTGLFRVTKDDEAKLAAVLGHEIVHALAQHMAKRMDKELQRALAIAAMKGELKKVTDDANTRKGILIAMGLSSQVTDILPFSQDQESEADHEGLLLMSQAGYHPQEAIEFWERMEKFTVENRTPELISTHPSYKTRNNQLKERMPEAQRYYEQSRSLLPDRGKR